jgi:hypothetical protein
MPFAIPWQNESEYYFSYQALKTLIGAAGAAAGSPALMLLV